MQSRESLPDPVLVAGLLANLAPFALFRRALPDLAAEPFDNIWIAEFTAAIVDGAPLTVAPDPWFRYVPQVLVLRAVSVVEPVDAADALAANAAYTVLCEAVLTPLALYWFVSTVYARREGLAALFAAAFFQFVVVPGGPLVGLDMYTLVWYYTHHWQYAFAMPWLLVSFAAVVRAVRADSGHAVTLFGRQVSRRRFYLGLAGGTLGVAGSIQLVQAGLAAYVLALALLWSREWQSLGAVAAVSMLVALPNAVVWSRYPGRWLSQGVDKSAAGARSLPPEAIALVVLLLAGGLVLAAMVLPATDRAADGHHLVLAWTAASAGLVLCFSALGAVWYNYHAVYSLKYVVLAWAAITVVPATGENGVATVPLPGG
jgi:hypothetical protein